jgi:hypothetical protein
VANALVSIYQGGLPSDHRQHIAFWADGGASSATDTIGRIDVWVLGTWPVRPQFALLYRLQRFLLLCSEPLQIAAAEEEGDKQSNSESYKILHFPFPADSPAGNYMNPRPSATAM